MRSVWTRIAFYFGSLLLLVAVLGCVLAEGALHIQPAMRPAPDQAAEAGLSRKTQATRAEIEITARDGSPLRATVFRPPASHSNGAAVLLLHGVADSRDGMLGFAEFLLSAGYTTLLPDSRGHGVSGGDLITYGLTERGDLPLWIDWLAVHDHPRAYYALGESMGAAILLQTLPSEPRLNAVVAECPFSDFRLVAADRIAQHAHFPQPWAFRPFVASGIAYARLRYGLSLDRAAPVETLAHARTPVLLIHGMADDNIPPEHSRRLLAVSPPGTRLWEVPRAGHVGAMSADPAGFRRTVLDWFERHPSPPKS